MLTLNTWDSLGQFAAYRVSGPQFVAHVHMVWTGDRWRVLVEQACREITPTEEAYIADWCTSNIG